MNDNSTATTPTTGAWRTQQYRDNIVAKLNNHIAATVDVAQQPLRTDARQMEANIYQKARSEHEYMAYIARLLVYIRDKSRKDAANTAETNDKPKVDDDHQSTTAADDSVFASFVAAQYPDNTTESRCHVEQPSPCPPPQPIANAWRNGSSSTTAMSNGPNRIEPNASQKLDILKNALAAVLQNPAWRSSEASATVRRRPQLQLFGEYVAVQLAQIDDEALLVSTQQKVLALLSKAV